jgi:hypothetical protein
MIGDHWIVERNYGAGMWAGEVRLVRAGEPELVAYARASPRHETGR